MASPGLSAGLNMRMLPVAACRARLGVCHGWCCVWGGLLGRTRGGAAQSSPDGRHKRGEREEQQESQRAHSVHYL